MDWKENSHSPQPNGLMYLSEGIYNLFKHISNWILKHTWYDFVRTTFVLSSQLSSRLLTWIIFTQIKSTTSEGNLNVIIFLLLTLFLGSCVCTVWLVFSLSVFPQCLRSALLLTQPWGRIPMVV